AADVVIFAFILYNILTLLRGTRAMQISIGLMLLGSTFFVARAFELAALEAISKEILFYLPFAVIVLFQHEIRRALARMGRNPLHDGAVLVQNNRVAWAGVFLPLTSSADPKLAHGTRHRAALGLSEESDAVIVVISEENGSIAVASDGQLEEHVAGDALRTLL